MKPVTEPAPWIFEANVTTSLDSFTLKKHVKMHAPTAKTAINMSIVTVMPPDTEQNRLYTEGSARRKRTPSMSIEMLKGILTGLEGFPKALMDIPVMLYPL
jgi:hypothetical protein